MLNLYSKLAADKKVYYQALEQAQKSSDITAWVIYLVGVILTSQQQAFSLIIFILKVSMFFDRSSNALHERQLKVIRRMDAGPKGFEGGV